MKQATTPELLPTSAPNVQNGTYSIDHPERGHFTVKLWTAQRGKFRGKRMLGLLTGPDNQTDFTAVAFWNDAERVAFAFRRYLGTGGQVPIDGRHWSKGSSPEGGYSLDAPGLSSTQQRLIIWADLVNRGYHVTDNGLEALPSWETCDESEIRDGQRYVNGVRQSNSFWAAEGYTLLLSGRCVKCNRELTDPTSIRLGIGPKCGGRS